LRPFYYLEDADGFRGLHCVQFAPTVGLRNGCLEFPDEAGDRPSACHPLSCNAPIYNTYAKKAFNVTYAVTVAASSELAATLPAPYGPARTGKTVSIGEALIIIAAV